MKALLQLRTSILIEGKEYPQIAGNFNCDENTVSITTSLGVLAFSRDDVAFTFYLSDDVPLELLSGDQNIKVIE